MASVIPFLLGAMVIAFPIVSHFIYLNSLKKRTNKTIKNYTTDSSEIYKDLTVWVKNFDILNKVKMYDLDPFRTSYDFNNCDLILNSDNFLIIGKTTSFGKNIYLTPSVFTFNQNPTKPFLGSRPVEIISFSDNGHDFEVRFVDRTYKDTMTLVIKRIAPELKNKLFTRFNTAQLLNSGPV